MPNPTRFPRSLAPRAWLAMALALAAPAAMAQEAGPISLERFGSFHVGGRMVEISGQPIREYMPTTGGQLNRIDPNGAYLVGQMYAQYMIPAQQRGTVPLLLWHGAYLTGVTYETTPDGRPGWDQFFLRRGWATYVSDAVERGRAGWAMVPEIFREPVFLPMQNPWERFRIGDGAGSYARGTTREGGQFPSDAASYGNFMRQVVPRFLSTDEAVKAGYIALLERVGPSVVIAHSQGGAFAWQVAQMRPDLFRALILIEPAGTGVPAEAARLKDVPQLFLYGDYLDVDARWGAIRANARRFVGLVREAGGQVEEVDLPARGIHGNSHMVMMDRNGDVVAQILQDWLVARGLWN
ncbi:alpha/beta hydrolase family protein [Humitalea rosea]|uniref:Alpha/beta hydrolase family protein n=1 Tax=Humitalea rosea TaxID=990373 RepID=A0A2W7IW41_9PROT|nr:alpha/beta fold hydrolase [Humitalea rosea]PZW50978.1 alpha/beta hydrolase family protein [Humitalea rosea]